MTGKIIPVLMYHHVSPAAASHCVHPDLFKQQMQWLSRSRYRPISGSQFHDFRLGRWQPEKEAVLVTFDDGWLDNWFFALPLLETFTIPAIFFIVTAWPGEGPMRRPTADSLNWKGLSHWEAVKKIPTPSRDDVVMRWSELRYAQNSGLVELHSHSHTHGFWWDEPLQTKDPMSALQIDLEQSKSALYHHAGSVSSHLCWPSGRFTKEATDVARSLGFIDQYSTLRGSNHSKNRQRLIRRIHVENRDLSWFRTRLILYATPLLSDLLGWLHQQLFCFRTLRKNRTNLFSSGMI